MAFDIFGFTLSKKPKKDVGTFITPENDDGAITYVEGGGFVGTYLNTDIETEQEKEKKEFIKDVRNHVKEIEKRSYIDPEGGTVDYVLMFIPNESIYVFLNQEDRKYRVAVQNLLSNQVLKLTSGPDDESPIFSPNGHMVLFTYKDYGKTSKIGTVSINGLKIDPLPLGNRQVQEPAWGPLKN